MDQPTLCRLVKGVSTREDEMVNLISITIEELPKPIDGFRYLMRDSAGVSLHCKSLDAAKYWANKRAGHYRKQYPNTPVSISVNRNGKQTVRGRNYRYSRSVLMNRFASARGPLPKEGMPPRRKPWAAGETGDPVQARAMARKINEMEGGVRVSFIVHVYPK